MNMLCLGVMKRLMMLWPCGPIIGHVRMPAKHISPLNECPSVCNASLPMEFPRKYRKLVDVERWKATEDRHFIRCFGPVVRRGTQVRTMSKFQVYLYTV